MPNKSTKLLKAAVLKAAEVAGDKIADKEKNPEGLRGLERYLQDLAESEKKTFGTLLGRIIPLQVSGDFDIGAKDSLALLLERINGKTRSK